MEAQQKRPRGRPRLQLTEEERIEHRKHQVEKAKKRYYEQHKELIIGKMKVYNRQNRDKLFENKAKKWLKMKIDERNTQIINLLNI